MFTKKQSPQYRQVSISEEDDNIYRDESDDDEEDFIQKQIRLQRKQLKKQDEGLEMLSKQASRLGELSLVIAEEVAFQTRFVHTQTVVDMTLKKSMIHTLFFVICYYIIYFS